MRRQDEAGFSLVELLVVLVITAVLMAIFVPTFLRQKSDAPNGAVAASAQTFEMAAAQYLRAYPYVGGDDPLLKRGGYSGPFTSNLPPGTGLYGAAGDQLVRSWPTNAFTGQPARVLRGACTVQGAPGEVLMCRPLASGGRPDLMRVRVIAWGKDRRGAVAKVYDSVDCRGRCKV